jgi:hypothetical protein
MKRKLMWLTAMGAVMALAYAQSVTIRGAVGFGLAGAPDAERPNAQFNFSVKQAEYNGQTRLGGGFAIEVREANRLVSIQMANAQRLAVDIENKRAVFSGPAVAVSARARRGAGARRGGGARGRQPHPARHAGRPRHDCRRLLHEPRQRGACLHLSGRRAPRRHRGLRRDPFPLRQIQSPSSALHPRERGGARFMQQESPIAS